MDAADFSRTPYVTHKYSLPYPEDGKPTHRQKTLQAICTIGAVLGSGLMFAVMLAPITTPSLIVLGIAFSVIPISLLVKYGLSKVDDVIIEKETNLNINLYTRLGYAAYKGNRLMVKFLLFLGANPNMTHHKKVSPALNEALTGWTKEGIVQDLLKAGAKVNEKGYNSPLSEALDHNAPSTAVKILLKWGANPNSQARPFGHALFKAAAEGKTEIVKALVKAGALIDNQESSGEKEGETPLCTAISHARLETVKALIELGADKDFIVDKNTGQTVLEKAIHYYLPRAKRGTKSDSRNTLQFVTELEKIIEFLEKNEQEKEDIDEASTEITHAIRPLTSELPELPGEVMTYIFSFLLPKELAQASRVSRQWCLLANDSSLWKNLCLRNFPTSRFQTEVKNWKQNYGDYASCSSIVAHKFYSQTTLKVPLGWEGIGRALALSPDGTKVIETNTRGIWDRPHQITLWDSVRGTPLQNIPTRCFRSFHPMVNDGYVDDLSFSKDGSKIIATGNSQLGIWKLDGTLLQLFESKPKSFDTSLDGTKIVMGNPDASSPIKLWDMSSSTPTELASFGKTGDGKQVALSIDQKIVTTAKNGAIKLWDINNPDTPIYTLKLEETPSSVAFSQNGNMFAVGTFHNFRGAIKLFCTETGELLTTYTLYDVMAYNITFLPNDKMFFFENQGYSFLNSVYFWNIETGKLEGWRKGKLASSGRSFLQMGQDTQIFHYTNQSHAVSPTIFERIKNCFIHGREKIRSFRAEMNRALS